MSTVVKKAINFTLNGEPVTAPEGTVILDAAKRKGVFISNLLVGEMTRPSLSMVTASVYR